MVTWTKLPPASQEAMVPVRHAKYYISASWTDWELEEMTSDTSSPGLFTIDAKLTRWERDGGEFQIVRNRDWCQVIHPRFPMASFNHDDDIVGPDDDNHDLNWFIEGKIGDCFRIEFQ